MSVEKLKKVLSNELDDLKEKGTLKGKETIVSGVKRGFRERYEVFSFRLSRERIY